MPIPATGRILGVDWGEVRIGLALSDETQTLASPLDTLVRRSGKRFPMARLLDLVELHHPVGVVVGLPLTLDVLVVLGLDTDRTAAVVRKRQQDR